MTTDKDPKIGNWFVFADGDEPATASGMEAEWPIVFKAYRIQDDITKGVSIEVNSDLGVIIVHEVVPLNGEGETHTTFLDQFGQPQ